MWNSDRWNCCCQGRVFEETWGWWRRGEVQRESCLGKREWWVGWEYRDRKEECLWDYEKLSRWWWHDCFRRIECNPTHSNLWWRTSYLGRCRRRLGAWPWLQRHRHMKELERRKWNSDLINISPLCVLWNSDRWWWLWFPSSPSSFTLLSSLFFLGLFLSIFWQWIGGAVDQWWVLWFECSGLRFWPVGWDFGQWIAI